MYKVIRTILRIFYKVFYKLEVTGRENLLENQGYVIMSNHIGQHDPPILGAVFEETIYTLGKKELFANYFAVKLFQAMNVFPVDRETLDVSAMKHSIKVLKKYKKGLLIFPEGTRNFGEKPLPTNPGVSMLAIRTKVPILPVSIDSSYKLFSKIIVTIHEPVDMSEYYKGKLETQEYIDINDKILNDIYKNLTLYKLRNRYEGN